MPYNNNKWININEHIYPSNLVTKNTECNGSVFTLSLNDKEVVINDQKQKDPFIPVITTSTNTDTGRNITSDGFIIFSFDDNTNYVYNCKGGNKYNKYLAKNKKIMYQNIL